MSRRPFCFYLAMTAGGLAEDEVQAVQRPDPHAKIGSARKRSIHGAGRAPQVHAPLHFWLYRTSWR